LEAAQPDPGSWGAGSKPFPAGPLEHADFDGVLAASRRGRAVGSGYSRFLGGRFWRAHKRFDRDNDGRQKSPAPTGPWKRWSNDGLTISWRARRPERGGALHVVIKP